VSPRYIQFGVRGFGCNCGFTNVTGPESSRVETLIDDPVLVGPMFEGPGVGVGGPTSLPCELFVFGAFAGVCSGPVVFVTFLKGLLGFAVGNGLPVLVSTPFPPGVGVLPVGFGAEFSDDGFALGAGAGDAFGSGVDEVLATTLCVGVTDGFTEVSNAGVDVVFTDDFGACEVFGSADDDEFTTDFGAAVGVVFGAGVGVAFTDGEVFGSADDDEFTTDFGAAVGVVFGGEFGAGVGVTDDFTEGAGVGEAFGVVDTFGVAEVFGDGARADETFGAGVGVIEAFGAGVDVVFKDELGAGVGVMFGPGVGVADEFSDADGADFGEPFGEAGVFAAPPLFVAELGEPVPFGVPVPFGADVGFGEPAPFCDPVTVEEPTRFGVPTPFGEPAPFWAPEVPFAPELLPVPVEPPETDPVELPNPGRPPPVAGGVTVAGPLPLVAGPEVEWGGGLPMERPTFAGAMLLFVGPGWLGPDGTFVLLLLPCRPLCSEWPR
jgi:hypothetical protein